MTQEDQIKRLKADKIPATGRPTKGTLIAKKVKSNPNAIKAIFSGELYDKIPFYSLDNDLLFLLKDVTLMNANQTFSKPILDDVNLVSRLELAKVVVRIPEEESTITAQQVSFDLE